MDFLKLITSQLQDDDAIAKIAGAVNVEPDKVKQMTKMAIPVLMKGMAKNAESDEGALSLQKALTQHKDDNVDDLSGFLNGLDLNDGMKMVGHMLGGKSESVTSQLAKQANLGKDEASNVMASLAPVLLGGLSKFSQDDSTPNDMLGLLGQAQNLMGGADSDGMMDFAKNLLDQDKDGSILDDAMGFVGKLFKK